jgi:hypothetical protein
VEQNKQKKKSGESGVVVHICDTSAEETEAQRLWVQGQPGLYSETLSQKKRYEKGVLMFLIF